MSRFHDYPDLRIEDDPKAGAAVCLIEGRAVLRGGVGLTWSKTLGIVDRCGSQDLWMTTTYRYNAHVIGRGPLLRYDNGNGEKHYAHHPTPHHKHLFDWEAPKHLQPLHVEGYPVHTGPMAYPTLGAFVDEMCDWVEANRHTLPDPEWFPELCDVQLAYQ